MCFCKCMYIYIEREMFIYCAQVLVLPVSRSCLKEACYFVLTYISVCPDSFSQLCYVCVCVFVSVCVVIWAIVLIKQFNDIGKS